MKNLLILASLILIAGCNQSPAPKLAASEQPTEQKKTSTSAIPLQFNMVDANYARQKHWIILADTSFHCYSPNSVYEEGDYKNGLKEGIWFYYNPDHSIDCKIEYKDDKPVKTVTGQ